MSCKRQSSLTALIACALLAPTAQALVTSATTSTSTVRQMTDYLSPIRINPETGEPVTITHDSASPDISKDGSTIVLKSTADLVPGGNPNNLDNIYIMKSDGTGLRQLTNATAPARASYDIKSTTPRLSANGKVVVFASPYDLTGENPAQFIEDLTFPDYSYYVLYYQIFIMNSDGTGLRQLTRGSGWHSLNPRISDDGRTIAFESKQDLTGTNGDHTQEIFVIQADGTGLTQITNGGPKPSGRNIRGDESRNVAISGDGTTVAFDSFNDLLPPKNDDWSNEIFVFDLAGYRRAGGTINDLGNFTVQVTDTDVDAQYHIRAEDSFEPSLSRDGTWVAFSACINPDGEGIKNPDRTILGDNPFLPDVIFIAKRDGSGLRQLTFSDDPNAYVNDPNGWSNIDDDAHWPEISADGTKIVFGTRSRADLTPGSSLYEIAMIDLNAPLDRNGRPVVEQLTKQVRPAVTQLTFNGTDHARLRPSITADASLIVLRTSSDLTGGNADKNSEIFLVEPRVATSPAAESPASPSADATVVAPPPAAPAGEESGGVGDTITAIIDTLFGNSGNEESPAPAASNTSTSSGGTDDNGGGGALGLADALFGIAALGTVIRRRRARRH